MMNQAGKRQRLRRTLGGTLAAMAVTSGAIAAAAPTANADEEGATAVCGYARPHDTSGAHAYWQLSCSGGNVTVSGFVEDTAANGRCARVKAQFPNGDWVFSEPACPEGDREYFSWTKPGSSANVYLYEYDV